MMTTTFDQTLQQALTLSLAERVALIQAVADSFTPPTGTLPETSVIQDDESPLTDEEIANLMTIDPLSPAEIIKQGLTGTWADLNISDGAVWVNEQKHQRQQFV